MTSIYEVLVRSRDLGFLGPGPIGGHIEHAHSFSSPLRNLNLDRVLDLGSGGGLPGLVLSGEFPHVQWSLMDANGKRCEFLRWAVGVLKYANCEVMHGRAEELAHRLALRHQFSAVVARSFGPPAVVAECATGFLSPGGVLLVSEPPPDGVGLRWSPKGLELLGMERTSATGSSIAHLRQYEACGQRWPRRVGIPSKRPLFGVSRET